jgi:mannose-6-phosphate isomerase-like protein (cupin superfamily)
MNDCQFKLVRLEGDFIWHDHKDTDETFIVLEGKLSRRRRTRKRSQRLVVAAIARLAASGSG